MPRRRGRPGHPVRARVRGARAAAHRAEHQADRAPPRHLADDRAAVHLGNPEKAAGARPRCGTALDGRLLEMSPAAAGLLDGHRLGQVAGLVHVEGSSSRDVVRQELKGDDSQDRLKEHIGLRDVDNLLSMLGDLLASLTGNREHPAPRARTSEMLESILSSTLASVATHTTGVCSPSRAIGPCFISPAA